MGVFKSIMRFVVERPSGLLLMAMAGRDDHHGLPVFSDEAGERARVIEALELIRNVDPIRHRRLCSDLRAVWVNRLIDACGMYQVSTRTCVVDRHYLEMPEQLLKGLPA